MYLKEIKAQGFKSFADKVDFELTSGITGIVGPNGSGKSNVVDAIKWVLGEQSVKSLRGEGNMTDVIFSGSKSRKPLNVASVTLIFDNTDHYLSLNFDEVAVKRRVYKDGTNEYFINGEQCRLKDISDLFLDSGIGRESFNIISQGKIDEIISTKPSDRRVIFEEAAGVLKYKKRKEEALRKLERTHDNMNRVDDIISELERQVEPLKEQRDKAILYNETNEELEKTEIALISNDIKNINYKYQDSKAKIEAINNEIINLSSNNSSNEAKIEIYKNKLNEKNEKIKKYQAELLNLTALVEKINGEKSIILERKKYEVDDSKLHNNILNLKEESLKLENEINNLENELKFLNKEVDDTNDHIKEYDKKISEVKNKKDSLNKNLTDKIRFKNTLENKIFSLKESIENNSLLPQSVKSILNNPKLNGIHNVVGNLFEVEEAYSTCISTSLGSSISNIVVENELCAKEAINYLKSNNLGRATFFPLNIIKPRYVDLDVLNLISKSDDFIDVASNLVKYDKKYNNIIQNQLGNVIVAKDIDAANRISKKINYTYRIVTLAGELFHVGGSLTGGNNNKSRNIISDKYELENSINELNNLNNEIKLKEEAINEADYDLKSLEDKRYLLLKEKIENDEIINNKNKLLQEKSELLNKNKLEINGTNNIINNSLSKEEDEILAKYYEAIKNRDNVASELEICIKEKNDLNEELIDYEDLLKRENSNLSSKNKELKDLEIFVNRMDVKLDNLLNILNETYNMTYEKAISLYKLEMEEEQARIKVSNLKNTIKNLGVVNFSAPEEYLKVSERYEFLINQRNDLVNAENILIDIIKEMDEVMESEFSKTFEIIKANFKQTFNELFKGGTAELKLTEPDNLLETGVEIVASPPGKTLKSISLLSGGEKTFTAISLLFAILKSRPVPFCILDEVEAALDEVNVDSFGKYLVGLKNKTQFILITHKKKTMEYADVLYGITMQESGVSKLVSVKLEEIDK